MKALLWLYSILCFVGDSCALFQIQGQNVNSNATVKELPPLDNNINIPWLASMPGNCQGIVLTPWLILSTANCLKKSKLSHLDISGVNDPESIPHGQRLCLHPKFNPPNENDPVKADIGVIILEQPINGDKIPLSQASNITLKSCSRCQFRRCDVYEYQSSKKLGTTRVKKIEVQLLDFTKCHHQRSSLEKSEGLCIQSQPREDCWIQRASPVLCLLKNRWELVGLIQKTSRICQNPTLVIKTAPYHSWMKRLIKASKKLLNPDSPLHCKIMHENELVPQIKNGQNYIPTMSSRNSSPRSLQRSTGTSRQTKRIRHFPTIFNFSDMNSFPDTHTLFLDKTHTTLAARFLAEQKKSSPVAVVPEHSGKNLIQNHQNTSPPNIGYSGKSTLSQLISDAAISYTSSKSDRTKSLDSGMNNADESFDTIMATIIKQWTPPVEEEVKPLKSKELGTTDDSDIYEYNSILRALSNRSKNQHASKANLAPNFPLSEKEGPGELLTSGGVTNKTPLSMESLLTNNTLDMYPLKSRMLLKQGGTIEPWTSSFDYNAGSSQDQADSVGVQNPGTDRFQIPPTTNIGMPSTPTFVTYAPLFNDLEVKNHSYQNRYSTAPPQGQSLFKPTDEITP